MRPINKKIKPLSNAQLVRHRRATLLFHSLKVWLITAIFVVALLCVVIASIFAFRANTDSSSVGNYGQQALDTKALEQLKERTPTPKDYLLRAGALSLSVAEASSETINNILNTYVTNQEVTNSYNTTELVTNNSYSTTELVTNNSTEITQVINTIMLLPGENIAVTEADGAYTISTVGTANSKLSNLDDVAINTSLLPGSTDTVDIGSETQTFSDGYFSGLVTASEINNIDGTNITIGDMSSGVTIGTNLTVADNMTLSAGGPVIIRSPQNPVGMFEVQRASGTAILTVDASASRVGIGSGGAPSNKLTVGTLTTANSSAQVVIATGGTTNKGLVIQGVSGQLSNLFEAQSSTGAVMASINRNGNITTAGAISATGYISTQGGLGVSGGASIYTVTNMNNALLVQNAAAQSVLNVSTNSSRVEMGTFIPTTLWIQPPVTTNSYSYGTNSNMRNTRIADFNGDGRNDFIVSMATPKQALVYINQGSGTFGAPTVIALASDVSMPIDVADVNNDGKADLLHTYYVSASNNGAAVMINNGSGGFLAPSRYAYNTAYGMNDALFGDMNGDSRPDILVSDSNSIRIWLNNGTGGYGTGVTFSGGASWVRGLSVADFDRDGKADVVFADRISNKVYFMKGNGLGGLSAWANYSTTLPYPDLTTVGDFNGDGAKDVAVYYAGSNTSFRIFLNTGAGAMGTDTDYSVGGTVYDVDVGNFSNSGRDDIVVADYTNKALKVFLSNTNGTLSQPASYATNLGSFGPNYADTGDFNDDGIDDIVINDSRETINVMLMTVFSSYNTTEPNSKLLVNIGATEAGQVIKGRAGQTSDYLRVIDSYENPVMTLNAAGALSMSGRLTVAGTSTFQNSATIQTTTDSTSGLRVQNAAGSAILNVDTVSGRVGIKTSSSTNTLSVNTLAVNDSAAQVAISTAASTSKGIVVQGMSGQMADLLQAQSSTGAVLASISATGTLTVASATVSGNLTINGGHIVIAGVAPTYAAGVAACTTPTITISGSDTSGTMTLTTGSGCVSAGTLATVTFRAIYGAAPRVMLSAGNAAAASLALYSGSSGTSTFSIDTVSVPVSGTIYKINYWVVQ